MKNLLLILILFCTSLCLSQDVITYMGNGNVMQLNKKISPDEIRSRFGDNQEILKVYNAGRSKKSWGNFLLYGGFTTIIGKAITTSTSNGVDSNGNLKNQNYNYIAYAVGGVMVLTSIPVKIGFSKKIKKAVDLMNKDEQNSKVGLIEKASFILNSNGFGIALQF
jgi:hypothetical protein